MKPIVTLHRPIARGLGVLTIVLMLLLAAAIGLLYLNRGLLFEHKTASNLTQSTLAMETAEAGIEWATGMLNAPYDIGANCSFLTTTNLSFRKRYVLTKFNDATAPTTDVVAATNVFPGCKITAAGRTCDCPAVPAAGSTTVASLGSVESPSFTVAFQGVAGAPEAVLLTVYACTSQSAGCSSTNFSTAEGNARVSVIVKLRPTLRAVPSSPLTCGTSCTVGGSYNIINTDVNTNGILINAGTSISIANGTSMSTLQGQPTSNAQIGSDSSLAALSSTDPTCSNSQMFNAYFGSTIAQYQNSPSTKSISCSSASNCSSQLSTAYNDGWRAFYFATALQLSGNNAFGSQVDPITIVTPNAINVNGNTTLWGLVFSNSANWNDLGTGSATIHGAQISCAGYNNNGNGTLQYDPTALNNARRLTGTLVRVAGSWRDFRVNSDTLP
jgi:hypothetical protein